MVYFEFVIDIILPAALTENEDHEYFLGVKAVGA
jgi:hypothetical protein